MMLSLQVARCSGRSIISFIGARARLPNINKLPKRLCSGEKLQEMKQDYKVTLYTRNKVGPTSSLEMYHRRVNGRKAILGSILG
jgi:hypothetical protein